ncbi:MAG: hypothetical protein JWO38_5905 [Gemmataceae bacterium]|nr:hypothetical protein [Gemmataceae bacterium]
MRRVMAYVFVGVTAAAQVGRADDSIVPVGTGPRPSAAPPCCPPLTPYPSQLPPWVAPGTPPSATDPMTGMPRPDPAAPNPAAPGQRDPFAQATEAGGQAARTFNENFAGDFPGIFFNRTVVTGFTTVPTVLGVSQQVVGFTQQVTTVPGPIGATGQPGAPTTVITNVPVVVNTPVVGQTRVPVQQVVRIPLAGRYNGVSVVENGNPRPIDQAYVGYNFYSNVGAALNPATGGSDLQRQTAGFEKTVLGGDASVGIRLPYVQQYGPVGLGSQQVGDLTVLFKYAMWNNRTTGDAVTAGFAVTAPTGGGTAILPDGSRAPHSWLFQPWGGFVTTFDRAYVQGITNLIAPSDGRDPTVLGNSLGVGYWLYRAPTDRLLTGITPIAEVHVWTPLTHRSPTDAVFLQDQVNVTSGAHFRFNRAVLSTAVAVPVAGPRAWSVEGIAYLSYWF